MIQKVKELRVQIDGLGQLTKELKPITVYLKYGADIVGGTNPTYQQNSNQIDNAADSLFLAKAWLGKVLKELGEDTPYANDGKRKVVEDIEPAADKAEIINTGFSVIDKSSGEPDDSVGWTNKSHIEKVDWLRQEIGKIWKEVMNPNFHTITFGADDMGDLYWNNFYTHLSEARFWLGFELQRVRETSKDK